MADTDKYYPGKGCRCNATRGSECWCDVDWTPIRQKELEIQNAQLIIALHDAIRRPMGVVPHSAEGLYSPEEADSAEDRRVKKRTNTLNESLDNYQQGIV